MREILTNLRLRWRALSKRQELERDLEDELAFHLAMGEEKKGEGSRRAFGNVELIKDDLRDQWTFRTVENLWRDLRYAARMLRNSPAFTLVAILSLAIGIGANTAIFSVVDAIVLKSLPVRDPEQLRVVLWTGGLPFGGHSGYHTRNRAGIQVGSSFPYPLYQQLVSSVPQFSDLMGFASNQVTVLAGAASHYAEAQLVSGNFFSGLGVNALAGRTISPHDDRQGAQAVAVVSYRYWERHLGLEPEAVGHTIFVNGHPVTIVGVAQQAFLGIKPGGAPDLYLPIALTEQLGSRWYRMHDSDDAWVQMMGRLRPGTSDQQALASLDAIMRPAAAAGSRERERTEGPWRPVFEDGVGGLPLLRDQATGPILILGSVVSLVLLIACANLANLLLARGASRRREIAVRLSIGAGRGRLIRQLLTESLLLAGVGAALGLAFVPPLLKVVANLVGSGETIVIAARLDWRTLMFTAAAAMVTALLFGLAPALRATRVDLTPALKDGGGGAGGSGRRLHTSRFLVVGQVALSTLLLAGAGLFVRTLMNLSSIDPGFEAQRLLLFNVDGSRSGYHGEKLTGLYERIREKVAAIPGVQSVTLSDFALISGSMSNTDVAVPGYLSKDGRRPMTYEMRVGSRFLATMGIPVLAGRDFTERDGMSAPRVGIVNETFARDYFAHGNPVGQSVYFGDPKTPRPEDRVQIIAVCKDAKYDHLQDKIPPTIYLSYLQTREFNGGMTFDVRTALPPMAIASAVERTVAAIERNVPVAEMRTQEEQIRMALGGERMFAGLVGSFGLIAALLAAIGLYGVMAYSVARRTNEIGIRMAMGAGRGHVQWMVLRESLWMVAAGLTLGIPAALALTRLVREALYGIQPNDPLSFVAAGVLMAVVAGVAGWIPARRAARVDPMRALRCE
ncbi:MAG: multidrug ABC transporter substrate-binding protein [Acidobacteria bacterium]|nr:MAG: multidrug ABC transporter substrate-binding protein [Acidobacteriota bacterium]